MTPRWLLSLVCVLTGCFPVLDDKAHDNRMMRPIAEAVAEGLGSEQTGDTLGMLSVFRAVAREKDGRPPFCGGEECVGPTALIDGVYMALDDGYFLVCPEEDLPAMEAWLGGSLGNEPDPALSVALEMAFGRTDEVAATQCHFGVLSFDTDTQQLSGQYWIVGIETADVALSDLAWDVDTVLDAEGLLVSGTIGASGRLVRSPRSDQPVTLEWTLYDESFSVYDGERPPFSLGVPLDDWEGEYAFNTKDGALSPLD